MKWQEIEERRQQAAAELQGKILEFIAENQRTKSNEQMAHADNLVKLLTHANKQMPRMTNE
jgi:hypothetical protein